MAPPTKPKPVSINEIDSLLNETELDISSHTVQKQLDKLQPADKDTLLGSIEGKKISGSTPIQTLINQPGPSRIIIHDLVPSLEEQPRIIDIPGTRKRRTSESSSVSKGSYRATDPIISCNLPLSTISSATPSSATLEYSDSSISDDIGPSPTKFRKIIPDPTALVGLQDTDDEEDDLLSTSDTRYMLVSPAKSSGDSQPELDSEHPTRSLRKLKTNEQVFQAASSYLAQSSTLQAESKYTVSEEFIKKLEQGPLQVNREMEVELKRWAQDKWANLVDPPETLKPFHFWCCADYFPDYKSLSNAVVQANMHYEAIQIHQLIKQEGVNKRKIKAMHDTFLKNNSVTLDLNRIIEQHKSTLEVHSAMAHTLQEYGGSLISHYSTHTNEVKNITREMSNVLSSKISELVQVLSNLSGLSDKDQGKLLTRKSMGSEILSSTVSDIGPSASRTDTHSTTSALPPPPAKPRNRRNLYLD